MKLEVPNPIPDLVESGEAMINYWRKWRHPTGKFMNQKTAAYTTGNEIPVVKEK